VLVVTIEVWPGGSPLDKRNIGSMTLANVSELAECSDYEGFLRGDDINADGVEHVTVEGHFRSRGAWELVRKALNKYV
jgi:hypothetical protein